MSTASVSEPEFIDVREVARRTGLSRVWIDQLRVKGGGPTFYRIGKRCLYRWSEVRAWIEAQKAGGGS